MESVNGDLSTSCYKIKSIMISKKDTLKSLKDKDISMSINSSGIWLHPAKSTSIPAKITDIGEDIFEVIMYPRQSSEQKVYYSIDHIVAIYPKEK